MNLERKVAIITERHQASFLLQQNVWLREERLSPSAISMNQKEMRLWRRFKGYGLEAKFYRCDVTSGTDSCLAIDQIFRDFGCIDIHLNSDGIIWRKNVTELTEDVWNAVLYLASDISSWTTGFFRIIDGGGII
jgi:NAD(P)-dependent dehydrogenase (short-subunit alcohol dehydrogenase family)